MGSHFSQKESVRYTCFCDRNAFFLLTLSTYHLNSYSNESAPENLKTGKRDKWLPCNNTNVTSVHTQGCETKVGTTLEMSTVVQRHLLPPSLRYLVLTTGPPARACRHENIYNLESLCWSPIGNKKK